MKQILFATLMICITLTWSLHTMHPGKAADQSALAQHKLKFSSVLAALFKQVKVSDGQVSIETSSEEKKDALPKPKHGEFITMTWDMPMMFWMHDTPDVIDWTDPSDRQLYYQLIKNKTSAAKPENKSS